MRGHHPLQLTWDVVTGGLVDGFGHALFGEPVEALPHVVGGAADGDHVDDRAAAGVPRSAVGSVHLDHMAGVDGEMTLVFGVLVDDPEPLVAARESEHALT